MDGAKRQIGHEEGGLGACGILGGGGNCPPRVKKGGAGAARRVVLIR